MLLSQILLPTTDPRQLIRGPEKHTMKKAIIAAAAASCLAGCVDPERNVARRALTEDGYTNIVLARRSGLSSFFAGCDRYRHNTTPFEATVSGHRVTGVVCSSDTPGTAPQVRRYD